MGRKKKSDQLNIQDSAVIKEVIKNNLGTEDKFENKVNAVSKEIIFHQIDTGDIIKVKQILDEAVVETFLEDKDSNMDGGESAVCENNLHFFEDHALNNMKLVLMTTACAFAVVAQFSPLPFPESRPILGTCCAAYFSLSAALQLIMTFLDKDCILITKIISKEQTTEALLKKNPDLITHGLRIRTSLPRFSEFYSVTIEFQGMVNSPFVRKTWSVGYFFDVLGMFDEYNLMHEIQKLYKKFESGNFDKPIHTNKDKKFKVCWKKIKKNE